MSAMVSARQRLKSIRDTAYVITRCRSKPWQKGIQLSPPSSSVKYPGGARATFCCSVDFDVTREEREAPNRLGTDKLLELSEKYRISMTWAICGRTAKEQPDTFRSIVNSRQRQEIGVHTYSHIDVSSCPPSQLEAEIERCLQVLQLPTPPISFVFPWNRVGNLEVLKKLGFKAFRGKARAIGPPVREQGLWNIQPTYAIDRRTYNSFPFVKQLVKTSVSNNSVFHLWLHPWDLIPEKPGQRPLDGAFLEPLFRFVSDLKEKNGSLFAFCTMGDLAYHFEKIAEQASS